MDEVKDKDSESLKEKAKSFFSFRRNSGQLFWLGCFLFVVLGSFELGVERATVIVALVLAATSVFLRVSSLWFAPWMLFLSGGLVANWGVFPAFVLFATTVTVNTSFLWIRPGQVGILEYHVPWWPRIPPGRIIAVSGYNGVQAESMPPGFYPNLFAYLFADVHIEDTTKTGNMVGIVSALDGGDSNNRIVSDLPLEDGETRDLYYYVSNGEAYIQNGGKRGPLRGYLPPNSELPINTKLFKVELKSSVTIAEGTCRFIISNAGTEPKVDQQDPQNSEVEFIGPKRKVTRKDEKGVEHHEPVWILKDEFKETRRGFRPDVALPGISYMIANDYEFTSGVLSTAPFEVCWGLEPRNQPMPEITTGDGHTFPIEAKITLQISYEDAPKVAAISGDLDSLIQGVVDPLFSGLVRALASKKDLDAFFAQREKFRKLIENALRKELENFFYVNVVRFQFGEFHFERARTEATQQYAEAIAAINLAPRKAAAVKAQKEVATQEVELAVIEGEREATRIRAAGDAQRESLKEMSSLGQLAGIVMSSPKGEDFLEVFSQNLTGRPAPHSHTPASDDRKEKRKRK